MKKLFLLLLPCAAIAGSPLAPMPFPVFLRAGFSSVLEFDEAPTRVVLGDGQSFQVEKLERSLVIKTLGPYASSNMFVYFREEPPRLFVLSASEDAEPTYYKKFESQAPPKKETTSSKPVASYSGVYRRGFRVTSSQFDAKKDYLTVEMAISADAREPIKPSWDLVRLRHNSNAIVPYKLWAERKEVQKDSRVRARFIFAKPNIPRDLKDVTLIVPIQGSANPISLSLKGGGR